MIDLEEDEDGMNRLQIWQSPGVMSHSFPVFCCLCTMNMLILPSSLDRFALSASCIMCATIYNDRTRSFESNLKMIVEQAL